MARPDSLTLITMPSVESGEAEFYLSDVSALEEGGKEWGFRLHGNDRVFICQFVYADEAQARLGAVAITTAMQGAVYAGPDEGGGHYTDMVAD